MPDVVAEATGALQLVPRGFALLVAFKTVNGADKVLGRIELHREVLQRCLNGKSSIATASIRTGFLGVFRAKKPPLRRRETFIETDEP
jgi:hypothetical protein